MDAVSRPVSLDDLLAQAGWVRALARTLVRPEDADDVEQQAWLAALERPPPRNGNLRAWFARVVRRRASDGRRGAARRRRHEAAVPTHDPLASPDELVARAELRVRLAEAVLALAEPYRSVVLLRYFEGQEPPEIAALQSVPLATVRSRLQRAVALLRERLVPAGDASQPARARLLALATGSAWSALGTGGALVVTKKFAIGLVVAACLLGAGGAWWLLPEPRGAADPASDGARSGSAEADRPSLVGRGAAAPSRGDEPAASVAASGLPVFPALARAPARLGGFVRDVTGGAAAGAVVDVRSSAGAEFPLLRIADERDVRRTVETDAEGRFVVNDLVEGPYLLQARRGADRTPWVLRVARCEPAEVELRLEALRPVEALAVRVKDAAGAPVAGASVEAEGVTDGRTPFEPGVLQATRSGTTDAAGRVAWADFAPAHVMVVVRTSDGRIGAHVGYSCSDRTGAPVSREIEVIVAPPGEIAGRVAATTGEPATGAVVEASLASRAYWTSLPKTWRAPVVDGAYEVAGLPPGQYELTVGGGGWGSVVEWRQDGRYPVPIVVEVAAGTRATADLRAMRGAVIEGRVLGPTGPLPGAWVRAIRDPRTTNEPDGVHLAGAHVWRLDCAYLPLPNHPLTHRTVAPDATGAYRIDGLEPGQYRVEIAAPGHAFVQHVAQQVASDRPLHLDATLVLAGVLQGAAPGKSYLGVRRPGAERCEAVAILPGSGAFTFPGLAPGDYEVVSVYWGWETVVLGRARVEAGRTTWVDLFNAGEHGLKGRLMVGGAPLAGASVRRSRADEAVQTDAEGRFDVRWERAGANQAGALHVSHAPAAGTSRTWELTGLPVTGGMIDLAELELGREELTLDVVDAHGRGTEVPIEVTSTSKGPERGLQATEPHVRASTVTRTDARGRAVVDGLRSGETYRVAVKWRGVEGAASMTTLPAAGPLRVVVPTTVRLVVVVRDARGEPVEGAQVVGRVFPARAELLPRPVGKEWHGHDATDGSSIPYEETLARTASYAFSGRSDAAGRLELPVVPAGACYLDTSMPVQDGSKTPPRASADVMLTAAGPAEVELRFP